MSDRTYHEIKNRLNLRSPQAESLRILADLSAKLPFKMNSDAAAVFESLRGDLPSNFTSFEREFPSFAFALATGVGKTRLMGAFIAYLHLKKGIKNFFVLAPNLTIYDKLQRDLGEPGSEKYVFRGIAEFAAKPPRIITGDNYAQAQQSQLFGDSVTIHVFNISKISSEMRGGKEPRIKRLSEYLGESYFDYLAALPDLVVLMDESHHYRAERGMKVINELKPVLGLELTATPINPDGTRFENVVFDYPLGVAMQDGFVKDPTVLTRKNFNPENYRDNPAELDRIKLEDGISVHESVKADLEIYSRDTGKRLVRPFMLVVAKDTMHASWLHGLIESGSFLGGHYKGRVMEIHSGQSGSEKDENIERLLGLENPQNKIEIVIHVNMLKEGWDVSNLFTIVPLRRASAEILVEQTLGRGLRLPYGERTGNKSIDRLIVVGHDKFDAIVEAANAPGSIIRRESILVIDENGSPVRMQEVVTSEPLVSQKVSELKAAADAETNEEKKSVIKQEVEAREMVAASLVSVAGGKVANVDGLSNEAVKKAVIENVTRELASQPQQNLFAGEIIKLATEKYAEVVDDFKEHLIPIPRITIQQGEPQNAGFKDFNFDTSGLKFRPVTQELLTKSLQSGETQTIKGLDRVIMDDDPRNLIVGRLIDYSEVDYDRDADLLYKLAGQAADHLASYLDSEAEIKNVARYYRAQIGDLIYSQMKDHFFVDPAPFEQAKVMPFSRIEPHNYGRFQGDDILPLDFDVQPANTLPSKLFGGFKKACHQLYKFDSKAEQNLAKILEDDDEVVRWMRPARSQFALYWNRNSQRYEPDFVIETEDTIFMAEVKNADEMKSPEVQEKAKTALEFCRQATDYNEKNAGKKWVYLLIPDTEVRSNYDFDHLVKNYTVSE